MASTDLVSASGPSGEESEESSVAASAGAAAAPPAPAADSREGKREPRPLADTDPAGATDAGGAGGAAGRRGPARDPSIVGFFVVCAAIAGLVAAMLAGLSVTQKLSALGITSAGAVVDYGIPALTAAGEIAAVIAIGSLLLAAFLAPPQRNGILDVDGYRAVRTASAAAVVWAAVGLLMVPMSLSEVSGKPLSESMIPHNALTALSQVEDARAWLWVAIFSVVLAVGCRLILRWGWAPVLLVLALLTLMPLVITGHSAAGGGHDVALNSLLFHMVAASLWAGGLFAVLAHARRKGEYTDIVIRRYSKLATCAIAVVAVSGVVNALVRMAPADLFTTTYGGLVIGKVVALALLAGIGLAQRRSSVRTLQADPTARRPLIRLATVEVLVFSATFGLAVALSGAPPPALGQRPSTQEILLGYELSGPPTFARLVLDWRFDLIYGTAAIVLAVLYALGVWKLHRRGIAWSAGRTAGWMLGCLTLLVTTSSGVGRYTMAMFSVHMGAHMAMSMLVPVLLVLGAPVTLALRVLKPAGRGGVPGPREWLLSALHSPVSRFLTHPVVASIIFISGFYGLYLTPIFGDIVGTHTGHVLMNLHFLLSGYLFYYVVLGIDPTPRKLEPPMRLGMVMATLALHAFFGIILMMSGSVMGLEFYSSLDLPWLQGQAALLQDQKTGGGITWASGELPQLLVMAALVGQWVQSDHRRARQLDRRAVRDHDADLQAHNAMFRELARRDAEEQREGR